MAKILFKSAIAKNARQGRFRNGIINTGGKGAEHVDWQGKPMGYEGYLADNYVLLTVFFDKALEVFRGDVEI